MVSPLVRRVGAGFMLAGALLAGLGGTGQAAPAPVAPLSCSLPDLRGDSRTFPETGHAVTGSFIAYWSQHGGLAQQGYPLSDVISETSELDGKPYLVQYFERAVFECHPENAGTPFGVLLTQLGTYQYHAKYPQGAPGQVPNHERGYFFQETGHTLGGEFRDYWAQHGGLLQQGYPLSDEFAEVSALDHKPYTVQYFERAVMEYHPENQPPYRVLLSQLGTFRYQARYPTLPGTTPTPRPAGPQFLGNVMSGKPGNLAAGGSFVFWVNDATDGNNAMLLGYNAATGKQLIVAQSPRLLRDVATDGHTVVWRDVPTGPNQQESIGGYSLAAGHAWPSVPDPPGLYFGGIAVDGDTLYYLAHEPGAGVDKELDAYDWRTGTTRRVATATAPGSPSFRFPVAGDGFVLWSEQNLDTGAGRLWLAPATNPAAARVIADYPLGGPGYQIAGDHVFWVLDAVHMYTISTGQTQVLDAHGTFPVAATGNLVAWRRTPGNGPPNAPRTVLVRDLRTGTTQEYTLPGDDGYQEFLALLDSAGLAYVQQPYYLQELWLQPLR